MEANTWTVDYFIENKSNCLNYIKEHAYEFSYLNVLPLHDLRDQSLVRFRGMVQDMRGETEMYFEKCKFTNPTTETSTLRSGRYRETIKCGDNEMYDVDDPENVLASRQSFIVVTIPGLNEWVSEVEGKKYNEMYDVEIVESKGIKRNLDDVDEENCVDGGAENKSPSKRSCDDQESKKLEGSRVSKEYLLNLPLPDRGGKKCIINIYQDDFDSLSLNEVYDFIGFINFVNIENDSDDLEDVNRYPPSSLIPTIQAVHISKLQHVNPLLTDELTMDSNKANYLHKELKMILTEILLGDELAADYLLCHLISTIYGRVDVSVLGKFSLNISNVPQEIVEGFGSSLYKFLELLLPHSHYLPMTLENLNDNLVFVPKKDHEADRLNAGVLQLSENTHLLLDETKLSTGRLNEAGCRAYAALDQLIKNQMLSYDFQFYTLDFKHNIPVLIVSEGKSLLPSDYHIILQPSKVHVDTYSDILSAVEKLLNPDLLNELRKYLTISRFRKPGHPDGIEDLICEDFAKLREENNIDADNLHQLLVLARLVAFRDGKDNIDRVSWKTACDLERKRRERARN